MKAGFKAKFQVSKGNLRSSKLHAACSTINWLHFKETLEELYNKANENAAGFRKANCSEIIKLLPHTQSFTLPIIYRRGGL
jgi:hypothetical protein